jgi:hypothetical protein
LQQTPKIRLERRATPARSFTSFHIPLHIIIEQLINRVFEKRRVLGTSNSNVGVGGQPVEEGEGIREVVLCVCWVVEMGCRGGLVGEEGGEVLRGYLGHHADLGAEGLALEDAELVAQRDGELRREGGVRERGIADCVEGHALGVGLGGHCVVLWLICSGVLNRIVAGCREVAVWRSLISERVAKTPERELNTPQVIVGSLKTSPENLKILSSSADKLRQSRLR